MDDEIKLLLSDRKAVVSLFDKYRSRLLTMIDIRMDRRLSGRIDPEDIVQETWIRISSRLADYLETPNVSFYVWARQITRQLLVDAQRKHFNTKRNANLDRPVMRDGDSSSAGFAKVLADSVSTPSVVMMREEQVHQLQQAMSLLSKVDQEVLTLRHFEQLSSSAVAEVLKISRTAATNRYMRALKRLRGIIGQLRFSRLQFNRRRSLTLAIDTMSFSDWELQAQILLVPHQCLSMF